MTTFSVKFLGCKVSQADAMLARRKLLEAGHEEVPEPEADLHVINTCCITNEAESKSRQSVRRSLKGAPKRQVYVAGCASNLNARQFDQISDNVTALQGIADDVASKITAAHSDPSCIDLEHDLALLQPISAARTRGFVKIQDGCDCHCAYCIIPRVRGVARSRPAQAIFDEVCQRVEQGQPEVVMTGISVGGYIDQKSGLDLGGLMSRVAQVEGVQRVRLSSVEVIHVKDSLVEAVAVEPKICPHLHIPMQSGDDQVLAAMGRNYDAQQYFDALGKLRQVVPNINITTDVIVGFPTEDAAAFERTCEMVEACGITKVHTFSFSPRPGTAADALADRVSSTEKKERNRRMRGLSEDLGRKFRAAKLGSKETVLVDKTASTQSSGYSVDYTRVYLGSDNAVARGEAVEVALEQLHADGIKGKVAVAKCDN